MSRHHDPRLLRLLDALPHPARRFYTWLIRPEGRWLRLPLGVALIVGGILGFLPVLGFWMGLSARCCSARTFRQGDA